MTEIVEEIARAIRRIVIRDGELANVTDMARAAYEVMARELERWKQRAFELECQHGDLKGVFVERGAAVMASSDGALADEVRAIAEDSNYSNEMVGIAVRNWFHRAAVQGSSGHEG